ncbi:hypothetical protein B296_00029051 [Ensete ventricosum]|uniref:Uncharacterized protein n=1 Tax=Ensete ventricosum TaxID=4639 RepID=A0A426YAR0_ENSVE|nr:hypothetical protein B296_00029051 [Ensete ventricosum]
MLIPCVCLHHAGAGGALREHRQEKVGREFMALSAFAATLIIWVIVDFRMAFCERLLPFWGKAGNALSKDYLLHHAKLAATTTSSAMTRWRPR